VGTKDPIEVVDYDPAWRQRFCEIRARLVVALGDVALAVEHVGSTAVPGLPAKPIVDVDVVVATDHDVSAAAERLGTLGYVQRGDLGIPGREAFTAPGGGSPHHLYVVVAESDALASHLEFRNRLRADRGLARAYGDLKIDLARRFRDDRAAYTEAKAEFIEVALRESGRR
jgi:GrpB-like predicted nucleotidyltransferase (UPF0157 family)